MFTKNKNFLLLHLIVFIWGWSPILGKLISVQAFPLVWFRMIITLIAVSGYVIYTKQNLKLTKQDALKLLVTGTIIAFHWCCFYYAIKISNVSVTLVAFATGTLFTSITEPIFYRRKIIAYELLFGMLIIAAIAMIFHVETKYTLGIAYGMLAALSSSFFTVFNSLFVKKIPATVIIIYELAGGLAALTLYLLFTKQLQGSFFILPFSDWCWLLLFSLLGTAFPFVASVNLMKYISPYTVTLTVNLETIYGITFAYFIWKQEEVMTSGFYLGTFIILSAIFGNALLKAYLKKQ